jgi:hypothetical protein
MIHSRKKHGTIKHGSNFLYLIEVSGRLQKSYQRKVKSGNCMLRNGSS